MFNNNLIFVVVRLFLVLCFHSKPEMQHKQNSRHMCCHERVSSCLNGIFSINKINAFSCEKLQICIHFHWLTAAIPTTLCSNANIIRVNFHLINQTYEPFMPVKRNFIYIALSILYGIHLNICLSYHLTNEFFRRLLLLCKIKKFFMFCNIPLAVWDIFLLLKELKSSHIVVRMQKQTRALWFWLRITSVIEYPEG